MCCKIMQFAIGSMQSAVGSLERGEVVRFVVTCWEIRKCTCFAFGGR